MKRLVLFLALGALAVSSPAVWAQCNGFDQFQTGSPTQFDLGPGIGVVNFQGVPIASSYGNADTIIQRTPSGTTGTCNIQVWALFMKSTSPITVNGQSADVYATINNTGGSVSTSVLPQPDPISQATGNLTITSTNSSGGTFNSNLPVNADLIFVRAGTSVTNPANIIGHQPGPTKTLVAIQVVFNNTPPPGYPGCLPADVFYVYKIAGANHPHSVLAAVLQCNGTTLGAQHTGTELGGKPAIAKACTCVIAQ